MRDCRIHGHVWGQEMHTDDPVKCVICGADPLWWAFTHPFDGRDWLFVALLVAGLVVIGYGLWSA